MNSKTRKLIISTIQAIHDELGLFAYDRLVEDGSPLSRLAKEGGVESVSDLLDAEGE